MKESRYKVKIVCGFRKEQEFTINANEAHKAYYLFNNPEKRGTFNNGLAIKGNDIQRIEPDYNATMGWHHTHLLDSADHLELEQMGVKKKLQNIMSGAKEVARAGNLEDIQKPLIELREKFPKLSGGQGSKYAQKVLQAK
jgi:hypothetical protein